jgi:polyphosphate kinase
MLRSGTLGERSARIKIPAVLPRLVDVPLDGDGSTFVWLEDLISSELERLFPGNEILAAYPFHVTRDADIEPDEEDDDDGHDLMTIMRETLSQRTFGPVVRLMVDRSLPEDVRDWLVDQLHASDRDLYVVDGPLGAEDLFELARLDRPDLKDPPFTPALVVPTASDAMQTDDPPDIFAALRERDVLLHHPYQSFATVVDFIRAAANDRDVVAIKQTLYRIGKDSPLVPALIEARDDDTQVAVLLELRARFDEENNIGWAEQLERRGVHVAYGLAGLKTHCKATLVVRREPDGLRRYVHLGTGNYNATTARLYEDLGLLSARDDLGRDVSELFNAITGYARQERYQTLWVAPARLRERFLEAIAREVEAHRRTGQGYLCFKMNQLVDRTLIRALYAASRAGVRIDLIVRGICCLRPGVPGWSETIRVVSIVGRFLEHSRVYYFAHGGAGADGTPGGDALYLGSADLMERNLDRRIEAVFPVEDPALKADLRDEVLPAYLRDTVNARELQPDGTWPRVRPAEGEAPFDVQAWLMNRY